MEMRECVEQILEGKYDYETSSLDFSCAKVELTLQSGDIYEGSFHIYSSAAGFVRGYVSSTDMRMECLTTEFTGDGEEILYRFHGEHMQEGEVARGNFCIISNQGEYYLPFVVSVAYEVFASSVGDVKNLFHFANLAKSNWKEAVNLFYSPQFFKIFERTDDQFAECYRGLSARPGNEQNVEEFLIRINKKQKVDFLIREKELNRTFDSSVFDVVECELDITRNGWGYTMLQVACEGDFCFTEKEILRDDDFLGNRCTLPVFIDTKRCREGKNFGRIRLSNSYVDITIPVTVQMGEEAICRSVRLQKKREIVQMMAYYQEFRMKRINSETWMRKTDELVEQMLSRDDEDVAARLYKAQLLISEERYNEAEWSLDHAIDLMEEKGEEDDVLYAYYLYLITLIERREEFVNEMTQRVERLYAKHRNDWRLAWLLLYLSEEYNKSVATKWEFLERQFKAGCYSPVFYIEGLHLLNTNPTLLRRLDEYTIQILYYGARKDALRPEVVEQILYLAGRGKEYSGLLLKVLQKLYEKRQDERILEEICRLLVRGNRVGHKYFSWYDAGVKAQLRITNLYEYYMMSIDLDETQKLPKIVLMYFSYQNNLDLQHTAFLYWYVEQHKLELGELYDSYRPRMEHFIVDQIQKERINKYLAYLYQRLLTPAMIDQQTAKALAKLLFAHRIAVSDSRLTRVLVYQKGMRNGEAFPLQNGGNWVPVYGGDSTILFEDAYGNRFAKSVDYTLEKLMIPGKFQKLIATLVQDNLNLDLYLMEQERDRESITAETADRMLRLASSPHVETGMRRALYLKLLRHYYDADNRKALDDALETFPMELFSLHERAEIVRLLVLRDKWDEAWSWVQEYGPYFLEAKTLVSLLDHQIENSDGEQEKLTEAALYAFQNGKYNSRIAQYLERYASCPTRELRDIWKAVRSYELDAYRVSERLILQMLFTGAFVGERTEIFAYYVSEGPDERLEEAFLTRCAYDYFVKERLTDERIFRDISKLALNREIARVCKLALLKFYAENGEELITETEELIEGLLHEMLSEKIHLNFFRNYLGRGMIREPLLMEMMDKTIVEYHGHPDAKVMIHYIILQEGSEDSEYRTEPMREVYGGVCFKEFILFFGESLQYYITEEQNGEEQLTESGDLQKSDIYGKNSDWRYEMINDILISSVLEDYDTLDGLLDQYYRREYLGENLFALQ